MEKIDILVATYNGEKYLEEQLYSILNQSYTDIKLLIRDDGSKDKTVSIIKKYAQKDERIKFIEDDLGNLGFLKNFEKLLEHSEENYIMFSDQDDIWNPDKIEKSYKKIRETEKSSEKEIPLLVHTDSNIMNYGIKTEKKFITEVAENRNFENSFFNFFVQGATCIINKKMKDEILPFSEKFYFHDRSIHLIAEFIGKREYIKESTMFYRQHEKNEIGAKSSVIKKILTKNYFDKRDRELIQFLYEKYNNSLSKEKKEKIENYLKITDRKISRIKRLWYKHKYKIPMNIKKQVFLFLKG